MDRFSDAAVTYEREDKAVNTDESNLMDRRGNECNDIVS